MRKLIKFLSNLFKENLMIGNKDNCLGYIPDSFYKK